METRKVLLAILFFFILAPLVANAQCNVGKLSTSAYPQVDIYKVNLDSVDKFHVIKKGAEVNLVLQKDISTKQDKRNDTINFKVFGSENELGTCGTVTRSSHGARFSMFSNLQFSTSKIFLENGEEVDFSLVSPLFQSTHSPHVSSSSVNLVRTITSLSFAASPATFGASLGISFLTSAILSACHNGISDFLWGGLDGTGLRFLEKIFRKQPDLFLPAGASIPFVLQDDFKISKGIHKETLEKINLSKEATASEINRLLEWGDLTGAIELSIKTGQKDIYETLIKKVSL